jgi:hypothetical protein
MHMSCVRRTKESTSKCNDGYRSPVSESTNVSYLQGLAVSDQCHLAVRSLHFGTDLDSSYDLTNHIANKPNPAGDPNATYLVASPVL